jgi:ribonuclease BN (tRNA processing enzyme)
MKVTILGSGSLISSLDHFGPGYLIEHNGKKILVDAGQGLVIQLLKLGIKTEDIDYIFITHFHGDHTADLLPLLLWPKLAQRQGVEINKKIKVFGQPGIKQFVNDVFAVFRHTPGDFYEVLELEDSIQIEGIKIISIPVIHTNIPAVAYRFESDNKVVVFSGDCTQCEGIKKASQSADLFIVDSSNPKEVENEIHLNTIQIGKLCEEGSVKKVILSHLTHSVFDRDLVSEVREKYSGEVIMAKDLMSFEV